MQLLEKINEKISYLKELYEYDGAKIFILSGMVNVLLLSMFIFYSFLFSLCV
jgi:hypothetical protein